MKKIVHFEKFTCFSQNSFYQSSKSCSTLRIWINGLKLMLNRLKLKVKETNSTAIYSFLKFLEKFD